MPTNAFNIKKNLERLLKEREWRIVDLEAKAKRGRVVHNIISGVTSNPGIDIIKSLADALNVDVEEFLYEDKDENNTNPSLLLDACNKVIIEITPICDKYTIKPSNIFKLIKEVYKYSKDLNLNHADEQFIKWLIKQYYIKD